MKSILGNNIICLLSSNLEEAALSDGFARRGLMLGLAVEFVWWQRSDVHFTMLQGVSFLVICEHFDMFTQLTSIEIGTIAHRNHSLTRKLTKRPGIPKYTQSVVVLDSPSKLLIAPTSLHLLVGKDLMWIQNRPQLLRVGCIESDVLGQVMGA